MSDSNFSAIEFKCSPVFTEALKLRWNLDVYSFKEKREFIHGACLVSNDIEVVIELDFLRNLNYIKDRLK